MTRKRMKSDIGVYHVVLRGINQQVIFEDEEDYEKLLQTLMDLKKISGFELYAYCIMSNHCHLLMKVGSEELERIFKRFGPRYVAWYNTKYKRTGYLFQSRYWSEVIKNNKQFLAALRYIHNNPRKAGICDDIQLYPWSSYNEYTGKRRVADVDYINELLGIDDFIVLHKVESADKFLDVGSTHFRLSDDEAKGLIKNISNCNNVSEFQNLDSIIQRLYLGKLRTAGVSVRQASRLTGVSKGIVERL